ncbi:MAG: hypothetical protein ACR2O4_03185 [Hyphomicrobiaceae bacterium]
MSLSIYEGRRYDPSRFMKFATGMNIIIAMVVLFAWQFTGLFVAEPISAATTQSISAVGRPTLLDTPYVYLWLTPLASTFAGWLAYRFEYKAFGRFVIVYPALLFVFSAIWYHYYFV